MLSNDERATMKHDGLGRIKKLNNPLVKDEIYCIQKVTM